MSPVENAFPIDVEMFPRLHENQADVLQMSQIRKPEHDE